MTSSVQDDVQDKSTLSVMDGTGDSKFMWSADSEDEVNAAKAMFSDLHAKGYLAYAVDSKGDKAEVIHKFDASAEKIIMSPPLAGG
jgi:hypothetical protein